MATLVRQRTVDATLCVPPHWSVEVANLIVSARRRGRLNDAQQRAAGTLANTLVATADVHAAPPPAALVAFAQAEQLTAYDAAYVDLALRLECPLITEDRAMANTARRLGVDVVTL